MKKIITALMASTMLMGATLPAAAAINPFNIDESSSAANIYKAIDKSGDASGVIGGFAWVKIGDEVYSMAIRELAKAGSAKKAKELFESYIAEEMMAERIALAKSNFEAAKEAVIAALATKPSGPGFFELAQAKLAYLATEIEYLEGMAQPEDFDYAPVVERLSDEQAAYFTALRKYVAGYVANVVAEDIDVTKHTAQHTSSVVVELSNGNFATVSFDDADKVTADDVSATGSAHADNMVAESSVVVELSNKAMATVTFHDAADVIATGVEVNSFGDVTVNLNNGEIFRFEDAADAIVVDSIDLARDGSVTGMLTNGNAFSFDFAANSYDAGEAYGRANAQVMVTVYGNADYDQYRTQDASFVGEGQKYIEISNLLNGAEDGLRDVVVTKGSVDSDVMTHNTRTIVIDTAHSVDARGSYTGSAPVNVIGGIFTEDGVINIDSALQDAHDAGRATFRQELNNSGTGIVVSGVYNPTVVYRTTAVDPQFGFTLTTGEYDSVNAVYDAGNTDGIFAGETGAADVANAARTRVTAGDAAYVHGTTARNSVEASVRGAYDNGVTAADARVNTSSASYAAGADWATVNNVEVRNLGEAGITVSSAYNGTGTSRVITVDLAAGFGMLDGVDADVRSALAGTLTGVELSTDGMSLVASTGYSVIDESVMGTFDLSNTLADALSALEGDEGDAFGTKQEAYEGGFSDGWSAARQ